MSEKEIGRGLQNINIEYQKAGGIGIGQYQDYAYLRPTSCLFF